MQAIAVWTDIKFNFRNYLNKCDINRFLYNKKKTSKEFLELKL